MPTRTIPPAQRARMVAGLRRANRDRARAAVMRAELRLAAHKGGTATMAVPTEPEAEPRWNLTATGWAAVALARRAGTSRPLGDWPEGA